MLINLNQFVSRKIFQLFKLPHHMYNMFIVFKCTVFNKLRNLSTEIIFSLVYYLV